MTGRRTLVALALFVTAAAPGLCEDAAPAKPVPPPAAMQRLLAGMGVQYFPEERKLEVKGWVNMQEGPVEVFACAPGGKTHESVIVLDCVPSGLHAGLLALGLEPGSGATRDSDGTLRPPTGAKVDVQVRWTGPDGTERIARAEDWIWEKGASRSMTHAPWVFAGSFSEPVEGKPGEIFYAADFVKSLVTTYHDRSTILENPNLEGRDDEGYSANDKAVPPVKTPVVAIFSPARQGAKP